jgi:integrase
MNQATAEATIYSYEDWLAICLPTRNTANTYRSGVLSFLRSVYGTDDKPEILAPRYIAEIKSGQRSYFKDLITYIAASHDLKAPPKTPNSYLAGVTSFLLWCCDIEATKERKMLKSRMGKGAQEARTEKEDLDRAKLRAFLSHCDTKTRALALVLLSSGLRIGEAFQLRMSDLRLDQYPVAIHVRAETAKTRHHRVTFMSSEAKEALLEWLRIREDYRWLFVSVREPRRRGKGRTKNRRPRIPVLIHHNERGIR